VEEKANIPWMSFSFTVSCRTWSLHQGSRVLPIIIFHLDGFQIFYNPIDLGSQHFSFTGITGSFPLYISLLLTVFQPLVQKTMEDFHAERDFEETGEGFGSRSSKERRPSFLSKRHSSLLCWGFRTYQVESCSCFWKYSRMVHGEDI
jgi:hypothetical protein